jgi:phosphoglycerol transferase MdoB-like AlkP superfamily enzyme
LKLLLLLSYLSIGVPFFWRDKRGWLALLVPALTMVFVMVKANGMGGLGSVSVLGFWLPVVAAAFLAFTGFRKFTTA